jgi:hypothetical protein
MLVAIELNMNVNKSIVACYQMLQKQTQLNQVESLAKTMLIDWKQNRNELKSYLNQASQSMNIIFENPLERKALSYFAFDEWLETMLKNK